MEDVDFLWGLMSYDDLSSYHQACFDTMNDIELIHWKETDTYSVFIEEAYEFKTPAEKQRYLTALEAAFTAWMKAHGYRTDTMPELPTGTNGHFRSIEAAYADFKARVEKYPCELCGHAGGRLAGPGDDGFKVLCNEHAQEYMNEALRKGVEDVAAGRMTPDYPYQVGPGWWHLLDNYLSQIRAIDPTCEVIVKEKFGLLRIRPYKFKDGLLRKDFWPICVEAEKASETVCELCGAHGRIRTDRSWWETLCDRCAGLDSLERRKIAEETKEQYFRRSE